MNEWSRGAEEQERRRLFVRGRGCSCRDSSLLWMHSFRVSIFDPSFPSSLFSFFLFSFSFSFLFFFLLFLFFFFLLLGGREVTVTVTVTEGRKQKQKTKAEDKSREQRAEQSTVLGGTVMYVSTWLGTSVRPVAPRGTWSADFGGEGGRGGVYVGICGCLTTRETKSKRGRGEGEREGERERGREHTDRRTERRTGPARVNGLFRDGRKREERERGGGLSWRGKGRGRGRGTESRRKKGRASTHTYL